MEKDVNSNVTSDIESNEMYFLEELEQKETQVSHFKRQSMGRVLKIAGV